MEVKNKLFEHVIRRLVPHSHGATIDELGEIFYQGLVSGRFTFEQFCSIASTAPDSVKRPRSPEL